MQFTFCTMMFVLSSNLFILCITCMSNLSIITHNKDPCRTTHGFAAIRGVEQDDVPQKLL